MKKAISFMILFFLMAGIFSGFTIADAALEPMFESVKLNGVILPQTNLSGGNEVYVKPGDVLEYSFSNAAYKTLVVSIYNAPDLEISDTIKTLTLDANGKGQYILPNNLARWEWFTVKCYLDNNYVYEATRCFSNLWDKGMPVTTQPPAAPAFISIKLNGVILPQIELDAGNNEVYAKPGDILEYSFANAANKTLVVNLWGPGLEEIPNSRKTITLDANGKGQYILPDNIKNYYFFCVDSWLDHVYVDEAGRYLSNRADLAKPDTTPPPSAATFISIKLNGKILPKTELSSGNEAYVEPGDVLEYSFANAAKKTIKVELWDGGLATIPGSARTITLDANGKGQYTMPKNLEEFFTVECWMDNKLVDDATRCLSNRFGKPPVLEPPVLEPPATTPRFPDAPTGHWAYDSIMLLVNRGVISGYPDGTFKPNGLVTRSEFAKMMTMTIKIPLLTNPTPSFVDVGKNDWEFIYVETAKKYLTGYQLDNSYYFKGKEPAVREDMAVALVKALKLDAEVADETKADYVYAKLQEIFNDAATISPNLRNYVLTAYEQQLISGYPDGTFGAQKSITRAETAALLVKVLSSEAIKKVTFE